eukprot:TRINITY_DN105626_c0_g1_i1.p1 TRINITY_DN105626_c0_g1~~TRINITY_DN105626_c0_g1_i1.p1  ORF type:complete len:407 (+),score=76.74 TRINITY_DN105626_c0_g1_i1:358-1578(+)
MPFLDTDTLQACARDSREFAPDAPLMPEPEILQACAPSCGKWKAACREVLFSLLHRAIPALLSMLTLGVLFTVVRPHLEPFSNAEMLRPFGRLGEKGWSSGGVRPGIVGLSIHLNPAVDHVSCSIDVMQTVFRLQMAGSWIAFAVDGCEQQMAEKYRKKCAKAILASVISVQFAVAAIASSVSDCISSVVVPARCGATVAGFTGELEALATAALSSSDTCADKNLRQNYEEWMQGHHLATARSRRSNRRLIEVSEHSVRKLPSWQQEVATHDGLEVSTCIAKTALAASFLLQAGVSIADATMHCQPAFEVQKGSKLEAHRICAVDITALLGVVGLAAKFLAGGANNCDLIIGDGNKHATCAADILNMYGATLAAVAPGLNLQAACGDHARKAVGESPNAVGWTGGS